MKPFGDRKRIMDGVEDARADLSAVTDSIRSTAALGMLAFALISIVALIALAQSRRG